MESTSYRPLDKTSQEIRILTLRAGRIEEPIRCSLETLPLDDSRTYEALSYS
jgi:hypothetical protein